MAHTTIIQNTIPTRYDPRVTVKPCEPARVPYLPVEILYQIAKALPEPKQVFNLALASKDTWEYLEPALYECEVTYEARLAHRYGGVSSTSLEQHYGTYTEPSFSDSSEEDGSWMDYDSGSDGGQYESYWGHDIQNHGNQHGYDWEEYVQNEGDQLGYDWESDIQSEDADRDGEGFATEAPWSDPESRSTCQGHIIFGACEKCDGRIDLPSRTFEAPMPEADDPIRIDGAMTALHWAAKKGASALPVAQKAIRSALVHQPSYINGINLQERLLLDPVDDEFTRYIPADLPPPLFLAVANGNFEMFKALLDAGCAVHLFQGQSVCGCRFEWKSRRDPIMSFKIHEDCMEGRSDPCICEWTPDYLPDDGVEEEPRICQTVGHVAVRYEKPDMLKVLLQRGLNIEPPQPADEKSVHLAQFAVREGSVASLKVLLDHDSSLALKYLNHETLIQNVRFIGQNAVRDVRDGEITGIISCLLQHGAVLDARSDDGGPRGLTALQTALDYPLGKIDADPKIFTSLHAAEVLIRMGANWEHQLTPHDPHHILYQCLKKTVTKSSTSMFEVKEPAEWLKIRVAWGRVFKTIIETAQESLIRGSSQNRAAIQRVLSLAFAEVVKIWSKSDASGGSCCPSAAKGSGKLLLSTGITPSDADLQKWRTLCSGEDIRG